MLINYVLDAQGDPQPEPDIEKWARWFEFDERRIVRRNRITTEDTDIEISTVFLGIDHAWDRGPPVLWETMIFGDNDKFDNEATWRYTSREDAIANHERLVSLFLP